MSEFEQVPFFNTDDFTGNPERRCPCLLLLDTSHSMQGGAIASLNRGVETFKDELATDSLAMKRVEIAVVTFGPVTVINEFRTPDNFHPMPFTTTGDTPMGAAIEHGLEMLRQRKQTYRDNGISYYRPWVFLITDGAPTDSWSRAAQLVRDGEREEAFSFFAVAVEGADMTTLGQIAPRGPMRLDGLKFRELFIWLSSSLKKVSASQPGTKVDLPSTGGWSQV